MVRHSYGTGCLCGLRQHVGPFSSFGAYALPLNGRILPPGRYARQSLSQRLCAEQLRQVHHALFDAQDFNGFLLPGIEQEVARVAAYD